jgi:peptidoglycan/xylan/chitin deacetylase (PgdA/CDA1 family)
MTTSLIILNDYKRGAIEKTCMLLRFSLFPALLREVVARKRVVIVNYHNPHRKSFRQHFKVFLKLYNFISMDKLLLAIQSNDFSSLPPRPMVLTFDDGHAGNRLIFDDLGEARVPFLIYAVAGVVGTRRGFWFRDAGLSPRVLEEMKMIPNAERLRRLEEELNWRDETDLSSTALSREDLFRVIKLGGSVGSHTMFHPILTQCTLDEMRYEISESKRLLESSLGIEIAHFAYPGGAWNEVVRQEVIAAGYKTARSTSSHLTFHRWVGNDTDSFALPVIGIDDRAGVNKAVVQSSGLWWLVKDLVRS